MAEWDIGWRSGFGLRRGGLPPTIAVKLFRLAGNITMGPCPSREHLRLSLAQDDPGPEGEAVRAHVRGCGRCRQVLDELFVAHNQVGPRNPPARSSPPARLSLARTACHGQAKPPHSAPWEILAARTTCRRRPRARLGRR